MMFYHTLSRCNYDVQSTRNTDGTVTAYSTNTFTRLEDLIGHLRDHDNGWKVVDASEGNEPIVKMEGPEKEAAISTVQSRLLAAKPNTVLKFDRLQMNASCCQLVVFVTTSIDARLTLEQYRSI